MGLIKFGGGVASISGKIGGTVFAHNRYGSYARTFKVPVDPGTAAQTASRSRMTNASTAWRALTAPQRTAWEQYAAATPLTNRLGETIYLSGQAMYSRTNAFGLQVSGFVQLSAAPIVPGQATEPNAGSADIGLSALADTMTLGGAGDWAGLGFLDGANDVLQVQISAPLSAGVTFHKGPWFPALVPTTGTVAGLINPNDPITIGAVNLIAGQVRILRIRQMDSTGRLSPAAISGPITVVA